MIHPRQIWHLAFACAVLAAGSAAAEAEIFHLQGQGQVRGVLLNPDQSPRTSYVVKTASGGQVTLSAEQVQRVEQQQPAEIKYDRFRADIPDTVKGQWIAAEWCRANRLSKHRDRHLQRIIELDPDHADARRALGYSQVGGRWATQEQVMLESGYVRSKYAPGKWVLPQEEELLERRDKTKKARLEWRAKLKRWDGWLSGDKAPQAVAAIEAITDPYAVPALENLLDESQRRDVRLLYVGALSRINVPAALDVLVEASLFDKDADIRAASLDELVAHDYKIATVNYIRALKHKDNEIVNRAGAALGRMGDSSAIGPLIDALVTTHTFKVGAGSPGQTAATFGTGANSGQFNFGGGGPKSVKRTLENRAVLDSLVSLTDGVSFNYDTKAWKYWYVARRKPSTLDARRDASP